MVESSNFNSMVLKDQGSHLILYAVGKPASIADDATMGPAVYLTTVSMRFKEDAAVGLHSSVFSLVAVTMVNNGGVTFVENSFGVLVDGSQDREGGEGSYGYYGSMVLKEKADVALFAYVEGGVSLPNLAWLTGASERRVVHTATVSDDDVASTQPKGVDSSCSLDGSAALLVEGCSVYTTNSTAGNGTALLTASRLGLSVSVRVATFAPSHVEVALEDASLERIVLPANAEPACEAAYQQTVASVTADGLDVTPLVELTLGNSSIAHLDGTIVKGLAPGTTSVHLLSGGAAGPSALLTVSNATVLATKLISRVVTGAEWVVAPPSLWDGRAPFDASVLLSSVMTAEGHGGPVYSRVLWSDGHSHAAMRRRTSSLGSSSL